MIERRVHKRASVSMKINYVDDHKSEKMGYVTDISQSGMYINTGYASVFNDRIQGIIDHENFGKVIWIEGRVVRASDTGMAVSFTSVDVRGLHNLLVSKEAEF